MKVLIVDDDDVTRLLLQEVLVKEGYEVRLAASGEEAVQLVRRETFPIIISDIRMLELDGMAVLRQAKAGGAATAVILMTGFGSMEGALEAVQEGAFDYVSKPFKISELKSLVTRAAKQWESAQEAKSNRGGPAKPMHVGANVLIGRSSRIVEVYKMMARAAVSRSNVLLTGERGTGKRLVAEAIHENSARSQQPFLPVSCASLTEEALERDVLDPLLSSGGGTLFLEEVTEMPAQVQIRLSERLSHDVRVMSAVRGGLEGLREDLFYRLNVIAIDLPPLRERLEDLSDLVEHFLALYSGRNAKPISHVSDEAMALLRSYSWPGNIRELEHAIERATALTSANVLYPEDFELSSAPQRIEGSRAPQEAFGTLEEMERIHILHVLREAGFNKSRASEILGIDRATLYRKAQRYGIELKR